jgi:hypothetical protein
MQPAENPYASPQSTPATIPPQLLPSGASEQNSIFNLDSAALGLMIVSSVEALMLATLAAGAFLDKTTGPLAGGPSIRSNIFLMVAVALCLRSVAIMAIAYFCMRKRQHYGLALLGAILPLTGIISWPICFSIPFGIWALIRLLRKDTRAAFAQSK